MSAVSFLRKLIGGGARGGIDKRTDELVSLCNALLAESGEYASTALAREALAAYQQLDERCREEFFGLLGRDYGPPVETVSRAAAAYRSSPRMRTSCGCSRPSTRRAKSSSGASTWPPAARQRWSRCAASS